MESYFDVIIIGQRSWRRHARASIGTLAAIGIGLLLSTIAFFIAAVPKRGLQTSESAG